MKAEELSIGDLVNVNRAENVAEGRYLEWQEIGMVDAISECFVSVRYGDDEFDWEEVSMDAVEPVPITPEILEKNGFELKPDGWLWCKDGNEEQDYIFIQFRKGCEGVRNCEINFINKARATFKQMFFVHELQNALRLCKIEKEIEL